MTPLDLLIYGLMVWRLSSLLVNESGPFHIFRWLRERVGIRHDDLGRIALIPDGLLPQALSCVWCASLWISFLFAAYGLPIVLAISAIAVIIETTVRR